MEQTSKLKLYSALAKCQAECGAAAKSGHNKFDGYKYAMLEDYCEVIREPMAKNGLAISIEVGAVERLPERTTAAGKKEQAVQVMIQGTLTHESGESAVYQCFGEGQDRSDKAIYKAITGAKKYLLSNVFNVPTSDDPEKDSDAERDGEKGKPEPRQAERPRAAERPRQDPPPAQREPAQRPPVQDAPPPPEAPIPTTAAVNQAIKKIGQNELDTLRKALAAAKVPPKIWPKWLEANYGVVVSSQITMASYPAILKVATETPDVIAMFNPAERQPGEDE